MQEEVWVSSPEPAVGVFTTAETCQGRLRRHFRDQSREVKSLVVTSRVAALAARGGVRTGPLVDRG